MNRLRSFAVFLLAGTALAAAAPLLAGSVAGRVMDGAGKPVPGAKVRWMEYRTDDQAVLDASEGREPAVLGETATGTDGRFRIVLDKPDVSVGVRISAPGSPSIRLGGPFDSSDDVSVDDVHVAPSEKVAGKIADDEGKPVAGARVRIVSSDPFSDQDVDSLGEATTGADGTFTILDAPAGARAISVRAAGYVSASQVQVDPRPDLRVTLKHGGTIRGIVLDAAGKPAAGALVISEDQAAVADAQGAFRITGVDAGVRSVQAYFHDDFAVRKDNVRVRRGQESDTPLRLARAAAITGTVVDESTRKPVAGARVGASSGGSVFGRRRVERSVRTDAHGRFRLSGLAPRAYAVTASREGFLTTSINGIAAGLAAPGTVHIAVAKAASIAGKVVDESGQGVAGAHVALAGEVSLRAIARRGPRAAFGRPGALSGPDGSYRIRNLAAARNLELEAGKEGYAAVRRSGVTLKTGDAVANVTLTVKKGLEARGKVVDGAGQPVAGAEVRIAIREAGGGGLGGGRRQLRLMGLDASKPDATSSANGAFVVRGLEVGEYTASVSRDGYARRNAQGLAVKAGVDNVWAPIALQNGVAIGGFVRDTLGQPIPGAQIFGISLGEGVRPQIVTSGPDGRFRVDGLAAQKPMLLNLGAAGFATQQKNVTPPVEDLVVVLKTAGTVRGRVEDGDTKRPLTDFTIARTGPRGGGGGGFALQIANGQGGEKAFQSDDGSFELPDVPAGKWTMRASAAGYRNGETSGVDVGEGETKEGVVISLRRGGSLSGRVLNTQGTPVPNASVSWQSAGSTGGAAAGAFARMAGGAASNTATTTDADGQFHFDGLPEGKITVIADHPDYLEGSKDVDADKDSSVDIPLGTGGTISGNVVAADGRTPIPGALVSLNEEGDSSAFGGNQSTRSDGNGGFLFEHLKGGRFKVSAQASTGTAAAKEVILADNQRQDGVIVSMSSGSTIRGTVTGLPPANLGGVNVSANGTGFGDSTQTDDTGNFSFTNVPAGVVRFAARTNILSGRSASANVEVPDSAGEVPVQIVFEGTSTLSGHVTKGSQPLGGLRVSANADPPQASGGQATGQTDDNGSYSLQGLNDGTFQLSVNGQGVSYRKPVTVSGATTQDVQVSTVGITGNVVEDGTGTPLESVTIHVETGQESTAGGMKSATTDSSGNYSIDAVDPGTYQVTATKTGYQLKTQSTTVATDPAQANFSLVKGSGITIQVSDGQTGAPLHGITAVAFGGGGSMAFSGSVSLDSTGKGEIPSLSSGRYSIYVFSDGYSPRCLPAVDSPSPGVSVSMTPGGTVEVHSSTSATGRLTDGSGMPYLQSMARINGAINVVAPVGNWNHVTPGSYSLVVLGPSGQQSYSFTVAEGQTTRLDLK